MRTLHRVLRRLLRKAGLGHDAVPSREGWTGFLDSVHEFFEESDRDRQRLTRSLDLATEEMSGMRARIERDLDRLRDLLDTVASGIGYFASAVGGDAATLQRARREFVAYIESILSQDGELDEAAYAEEQKIRDEFVRLADSVIFLVEESATAGRLQGQMELAGTIQRLMVPPDGLIQRPGLSVASLYRPAAYCGGDWWSIQQLDWNQTMIIVGDITGHGVASAVMAGAAKGACDAVAVQGPQAILQAAHNLLYGPESGRLAMTCAIAVIDNESETLHLTSAGHPFPLLIAPGGVVSPVIAPGDPIGILPQVTATDTTVPMPRGTSLLFYTDGITECENAHKQQFGDRRMRHAIRDSGGASAAEILDSIVRAVENHRGDHPLEDDLTLIVAQRS
ncbi:PP2C family protein-serine/threonine phosphatase [Haliangium ochraceum]|nr:PP2C family protein-serine/threonine phosphatase [Haliangium ochraceum]